MWDCPWILAVSAGRLSPASPAGSDGHLQSQLFLARQFGNAAFISYIIHCRIYEVWDTDVFISFVLFPNAINSSGELILYHSSSFLSASRGKVYGGNKFLPHPPPCTPVHSHCKNKPKEWWSSTKWTLHAFYWVYLNLHYNTLHREQTPPKC